MSDRVQQVANAIKGCNGILNGGEPYMPERRDYIREATAAIRSADATSSLQADLEMQIAMRSADKDLIDALKAENERLQALAKQLAEAQAMLNNDNKYIEHLFNFHCCNCDISVSSKNEAT